MPRVDSPINLLCLFTKQYIYKQRCLNKQISFAELGASFRNMEKIEKYIATKNGKTNIHNKKWKLQDSFEENRSDHSYSEFIHPTVCQ